MSVPETVFQASQILMKNWRPRVFLLLCVLAIYSQANTIDLDVPREVQEALEKLSRTQAAAADWEKFGVGSKVRFKKRSESNTFGVSEETYSETLTERRADSIAITTLVEDTGDQVTLSRPLVINELDRERANRRLPNEKYNLGGREYIAYVYQYYSTRYGKTTVHTYWIAPGIHDGVLQHREKTTDLLSVRKYTKTLLWRLVDINVPIVVNGKTVRTYCWETESGDNEGKRSWSRLCRSDRIPGGLVKGAVRTWKDSREVGSATIELLEYVIRSPNE